MNYRRTVFAQLLEFVPFSHFEHLFDVYQSNEGVSAFFGLEAFHLLANAQLTRRSGLRDLVACLNAQRSKLYHFGIYSPMARSTLADAAERQNFGVFEALVQRLIVQLLALYGDENTRFGTDFCISSKPIFPRKSRWINWVLKPCWTKKICHLASN